MLRVNGNGKMVPCLFYSTIQLVKRHKKEDSTATPKESLRHVTCYESRGGVTNNPAGSATAAFTNKHFIHLSCMPSRLRKRKSRSPLPPPQNSTREMPRSPVLFSPGITTSLDSAQITPRTPRTARPKYAEVDDSLVGRDVEEVEMTLLSVDERSRAEHGFTNGYLEGKQKAPIISLEDKRAMVLLCVLCAWLLSSSPPMMQMTK